MALFRGALELDPSNTLAKAGLVRVADRLLSAAERALTAGNAEDARKMVDVAESLTPATARGAFLMMQIEMEQERAALTGQGQRRAGQAREGRHLSAPRERPPAQRRAHRAFRRTMRASTWKPRNRSARRSALAEISRALQKQLLTRAAAAAVRQCRRDRTLAGQCRQRRRARAEMTAIRRSLQDTLIGARAGKMATLTQSFTRRWRPTGCCNPPTTAPSTHLLALINTDAGNPAVATARQSLGHAYLRELRGALARNDVAAADGWLLEARTIGLPGEI